MSNDLSPLPYPAVFISAHHKPVTTSLAVAEYFGKLHQHVLRTIQNLLPDLSEGFRLSNFGQSVYRNKQNHEQPMFLLTKDGFAMVAFSFTGKKAVQFKENYIQAFNAMEKELREGNHAEAFQRGVWYGAVHALPPQRVQRAEQSIMLTSEGMSQREAAKHLGCCKSTVGRDKNRFAFLQATTDVKPAQQASLFSLTGRA